MTPTAGGPRAAADLQDELDELLVEYLSKLDVYQGVQERLSGELKKGYFDLARAKLTLGPTRVGQSTYDLGECRPQFAVKIGSTATGSSSSSPTTSRPPTISLSLHPTPPLDSPPLDSLSEPSSSTLRQRTMKSLPSSLPSPPPTPTPTEPAPPPPRSLLRDPVRQFAAFPPVAIKEARKDFKRAVELLVEKVGVEKGLVELEGRIREVRRGLKEGVGAGTGLKEVQVML